MDRQIADVKYSFMVPPSEFLSGECRQELFSRWNLLHESCLITFCSKILGYFLISLIAVAQIPQIMKILRQRNGQGISQISVLLLLEACTVKVAYCIQCQLAISIWGESIMMMSQYLIMSCLILLYHHGHRSLLVFLVIYISTTLVLLMPLMPEPCIVYLKVLNLPIVAVGKALQIYTTYKQGSTGQLSSASGYILQLRSYIRLLTSMADTTDPLLIASYSQTCFWNSILSFQMIYYKRKNKKM